MKKVLLVFAIFLILVFGMVFVQNYLKTKNFSLLEKNSIITINNRTFELRVADSQKEKEIGLSATKSLQENQGMIFIFDKPDYHPFWMKNMTIPIDIIYINNDKIVTIINNAPPPKNQDENLTIYIPTEPSNKVLEIKAGLSKTYNFKKGDEVRYENLSN